MDSSTKLMITPRTRVAELFDNFPELEQVLLDLSPSFAKLKNPILRKTVAKVATLQQAASIGNISVRELINTLRAEIGQEMFLGDAESDGVNTKQPDWFDPELVDISFDAGVLIEAGENPMQNVFLQLKSLEKKKIFQLSTPFVPAPIIELLTQKGYAHFCRKLTDNQYHTYFIWSR